MSNKNKNYKQKNCCMTLLARPDLYPTVYGMVKEHVLIEKRLKNFKVALDNFYKAGIESWVKFFNEDLPTHVAKEEQVIFLLLSRHISPDDSIETLGHLIEEHHNEMSLNGWLRDLLISHEAGAATENEIVTLGMKIYSGACHHIEKENFKIFPSVENLLPEEDKALLKRKLDAIGYIA